MTSSSLSTGVTAKQSAEAGAVFEGELKQYADKGTLGVKLSRSVPV